ncbi:unnamed protein product [Prorocentrum cordatum]|uniref:Altered inheritance of mitochondria protein 24, mitochondrial n=1 Tax=Prorocentrum cordatum TaxID=2364126 RepID=A0ABN9X128_9DINO|nr:unnamed protein product [Polarella glacialis]
MHAAAKASESTGTFVFAHRLLEHAERLELPLHLREKCTAKFVDLSGLDNWDSVSLRATAAAVKHSGLNDLGAQRLAQVLHAHTVLFSLDLSHNRVGDAGVAALAEVVQGGFATLEVQLEPGEFVHAESDACVTRTPSVTIRGKMTGPVWFVVLLLVGSPELTLHFFATGQMQRTRAQDWSRPPRSQQAGSAVFAPKYAGYIGVYEPAGEALLIRRGAFLAASSTVGVTTKTLALLKGSFSGTGFFCLRAAGPGKVAFSTCGAILRYDLGPSEERIVDNDHVVAWTEQTEYRIGFAARSMWHSATSGEGLNCFFKGPGTVFVQSHAPKDQVGSPARGAQAHHSFPCGDCFRICFFVLLICIFLGDALKDAPRRSEL